MALPSNRNAFLELLAALERNSAVTIVPASEVLYRRGWDFYRRRPDKAQSLTDCISFVVMQDHGIVEALTGDRFTQAAFAAFLE